MPSTDLRQHLRALLTSVYGKWEGTPFATELCTFYGADEKRASKSAIRNWVRVGAIPGKTTNGYQIAEPQHGRAIERFAEARLDPDISSPWLREFRLVMSQALAKPAERTLRTRRLRVYELLNTLGKTGIPVVGDINLGDDAVWFQRSSITGGDVPSYVQRPCVDGRLDELIDQATQPDATRWQRFVIAEGEPKSGKTRSLLERLTARHATSPLLIPTQLSALPELLTQLRLYPTTTRLVGNATRPTILLLDDLQRAVSAPGIDHELLCLTDDLPNIVVCATIHSDVLQVAQREADREPTGVWFAPETRRALLSRSVHVPSRVTVEELVAAAAFLAQVDPNFDRERLLHLGYTLADIDTLLACWTDTHVGVTLEHHVRSALLDALLDGWFIEAGDIDDNELRRLATHRYTERKPGTRSIPTTAYSAAVAWIAQPVRRAPYSFDTPTTTGHRLHDGVAARLAPNHQPPTQDLTPDQDFRAGLTITRLDHRRDVAEPWYAQAAIAGYIPAMTNLGVLRREQGHLVGDDSAEAWWLLAAEASDSRAMHNLGVLRFDQGRLTGDDSAESWWTQAVIAGSVATMNDLGELNYKLGRLDGDDSATSWWSRAAAAGHLDAMDNLGLLRHQSGLLEGADSAESWWTIAANAGHTNAIHSLGVLRYQQGRLDGDDSAESWLLLAAKAGQRNASFHIGILRYDQGRIAGDDSAESWWTIAATAGHTEAMNHLGELRYEQGRLTGEDSAESWWTIAANTDHPDAINNLGRLLTEQ